MVTSPSAGIWKTGGTCRSVRPDWLPKAISGSAVSRKIIRPREQKGARRETLFFSSASRQYARTLAVELQILRHVEKSS